MKPIRFVPLVLLVCLSIVKGPACAGVILQPAAASTNMGAYFPTVQAHDKSGLSANYTSLVDDFDTYLAGNPTAQTGASRIWGSAEGVRSGTLTFDLGAAYTLTSMALWNLADDPSAIREFELLIDDNLAFSSPTNVGSFTASNSLGTSPFAEAQVFTFSATQGSFVRLEIQNTWSATSFFAGVNEVAFEVVPEPSALALASLVLAALAVLKLPRLCAGFARSRRF